MTTDRERVAKEIEDIYHKEIDRRTSRIWLALADREIEQVKKAKDIAHKEGYNEAVSDYHKREAETL